MCQLHFLDDPLEQFKLWYQEAVQKEHHPAAMTLATANLKGKPTARTVLYKGVTKSGFLFFTNHRSRKIRDLSENPYVAWVFYWPRIYRQICGEGCINSLTREETESYFKTRSYESQISAWISEQSQEIPDRKYLLDRQKQYRKAFPKEVRCPNFWGGFRLMPTRMEFWIGRKHRLHDRFCYTKKNNGQGWKVTRLAP
ncbi:pyridoxamine 5'-phosphate oxidase [Coxiella endosymbiont of Amblyomma americanum]|uniref:pyridoxamine 5'-phosphate oxidase n=1 Tax=Coxiella endosymbiont of Amblyomma americanum TaxID=325775 RepID=UPI00057FF554|nr:pyridoxamine 5'-phosphate oxidase [Coxiella endosymbiont of Amblyomma americanum]AJC50577.1 pyridoxine 5'-phosphate oxidase [Coxiella endosymbiont of Amblyomma americanum]AUJ58908.1 pyridoxamine 5'-phosphate oxidase [Coxiella-like endosymbiont of Amblyomma americanum]